MLETLEKILVEIDSSIFYLKESDTAWSVLYTTLCRERRIIKRTIRKIRKLEAKKYD